jgi:hypothetical protein
MARNPGLHPFTAYSREVLAFRLSGPAASAAPLPCLNRGTAERTLERVAAAKARSGKEHLLLLGLGDQEWTLRLARRVNESGPAGLLVSELDPDLARDAVTAEPAWLATDAPAPLLADSSAWAHLLMWHGAGLNPENTLVLANPTLSPGARQPVQSLARAFAGLTATEVPQAPPDHPPLPSLSFYAVLHPREPGLEAFFAAIPPQVSQTVIVWDAQAAPASPPPAPNPVHLARPLAGDFAAQRNLALSACTGDWVLTLDADETLAPWSEAHLPGLLGLDRVRAVWLPRLTLYPDPEHALAGYGLWPDLQLRLFRRGPGPAYVRPVHERLTGAGAPQAVALDLPILHHSRLTKDPQALARKLEVFDAAGGLTHRLGEAYPSLPLEGLPGGRGPSGSCPARALLSPLELEGA